MKSNYWVLERKDGTGDWHVVSEPDFAKCLSKIQVVDKMLFDEANLFRDLWTKIKTDKKLRDEIFENLKCLD